MKPGILGEKYNKIASWWHEKHQNSNYGVNQAERALRYAGNSGEALDVGCGAGGRMIKRMIDNGFNVTGIDVSEEMIRLARKNHPDSLFMVKDICSYETAQKFDFIIAWDSIFHLPLASQRPVIDKLCGLLCKNGILIYTFGDAQGDHTDTWHEDTFYYSSIGINGNLQALTENGLTVLHLELDQYPEKHVYVIAKKREL